MSCRAIFPKYVLATIVLALCALPGVDASQRADRPPTRAIKVLGIGNSFTGNAFTLLPIMRSRDGECRIILGRAIIGGCSMEKHMRLAKLHEAKPDDPAGKRFVLWITDGRGKRTRIRVGLREMLAADTWDVVRHPLLPAAHPWAYPLFGCDSAKSVEISAD